MTRTVFHQAKNPPPTGNDRSINQDDDSEHAPGGEPLQAGRDALAGADAWNKPGLVDAEAARDAGVKVDFDVGPAHERRRH